MTEYTETSMDHLYSHLLILHLGSHSFSSIRTLYFWEYQQRRKEASVSHLSSNEVRTMQFMDNAVYGQCCLWTMQFIINEPILYVCDKLQTKMQKNT